MKAIVVTDQAAGMAGVKLLERNILVFVVRDSGGELR